MNAQILIILSLLALAAKGYITYIEPRHPLLGDRPKPGTPWPLPQKWAQYPQILTLDPMYFQITSDARGCDVIDSAITRYRDLIFWDKRGFGGVPVGDNKAQKALQLQELRVIVENSSECPYPQYGDDESYLIQISLGAPGVIRAKTIWGALRGLETFSQLVYQNNGSRAYFVNVTEIKDWPRYIYRGLLLDTARHYLPKRIILANLDAMAYNKFNVFHWHLVDDQSFPMESKRFPDLHRKGAYSRDLIYTQKDIKYIIEYARMRGIRVLPEIDSPGHTRALGNTFYDLLTPCFGAGPQKPYTPNYPEHSEAEILNPINNKTYRVMRELFEEVQQLFHDKYIHLGMDEVYYACWSSNPDIREFMMRNGMSDINQVEQYYVRRTTDNIRAMGYQAMVWQDPIDNGARLANDTIVEVWKDVELDPSMKPWRDYIVPVARQGYQIVVSACWYLNYIQYPYPGKDWEKYYKCNPRSFQGSEAERNLVVGGEACMWSEFVDATNLLSRLWPRASAVAERLWSDPPEDADEDTVRFRLDQFRCRLVQRGIPASPILNGYCESGDWGMEPQEPLMPGDRIRTYP